MLAQRVNKHCPRCNRDLPATNEFFSKQNSNWDGLAGWCKECMKAYHKERWQDPEVRKRHNERAKERRAENPDPFREKGRKCYLKHIEERRAAARTYHWEHRDEKLAYFRQWYADPANHERHAQKSREWAQTHKEELRAYQRERSKQPLQRLNDQMSRYINRSLKEGKRGHHWEDLVGYTLEDLVEHIGKQLEPGMTWENRGSVWHIDHIIPKSAFHFESYNDPEFKKCWALSNLQPLWAHDNLSKNKKLPWVWRPEEYKKPRKTKA
jgi:hypothetical protein